LAIIWRAPSDNIPFHGIEFWPGNDVRFLLQVMSDEHGQKNSESKELRWIPKDRYELPNAGASIVRMVEKWMRF
jgi:hypothetical protein